MKLLPDTETCDRSRFDFMRNDEAMLLFFRKHGVSLLFKISRHWLSAFLIFLFILWIEFEFITFDSLYIPAMALHLFNIFSSLLLVHWLFTLVINHFLNFMVVTNRNIIRVHKTIFLKEDINQIPFETVQAVHHDKSGIISNLFQYGTLKVESSGMSQNIHMRYVPRSDQKLSKISEIHGDHIAAPEVRTETEA